MTEGAVLSMRGICKSFFGVEVLHKVDFSVDKGEIMGLCGENGAGKSTLMKILAGIHAHGRGRDRLQGQRQSARNATPLEMQHLGVSMIHQELNLLNELTVAQNIFLCREPRSASGLINFKQDERGRGARSWKSSGRRSTPSARSGT